MNYYMILKKLIVSVVLSVSFVLWNASFAVAQPIAVSGDLAIVIVADELNKTVVATNLSTGVNDVQCLAPPLDPLGNPLDSLLLATATDVLIEGDKAVFTAHGPSHDDPRIFTNNIIAVVDISSCSGGTPVVVAVQECISTVNIDEGLLIIPCVEINGEVVTVHMEQRGKSSNWEVSFLGANPNFGAHDDHDHDDDHDDD